MLNYLIMHENFYSLLATSLGTHFTRNFTFNFTSNFITFSRCRRSTLLTEIRGLSCQSKCSAGGTA